MEVDITEHLSPKQIGVPDSVSMNNISTNYRDIVDSVAQNNAFSAEQAQRQMTYQTEMFDRANQFNANQAEIDRRFQQESADRAMNFSSAEAEANRSWQKMMSDTAHRREMADLKAAGLNPVLAANNGASAGTGSSALSAQAAGYAANSVGAPSGSKAEGDRSGTAAIASILGKMLDNNVELEKMRVSAETARETADMYTGATRYAAELGMIASDLASQRSAAASDLASQRSAAASRYSSDQAYAASLNNPYNLLGNQIGEMLGVLKGEGISPANSVKDIAAAIKSGFRGSQSAQSGYDRTLQYIDTAGTGHKIGSHIGRSILNSLGKAISSFK